MEGLQFLGIFACLYGILWAKSVTRDAKSSLATQDLERIRPIERPTILNSVGPLVPLVAGLGIVTSWPGTGLGIVVAAILLTVGSLALKGVVHAKRMRGAGVPEAYGASYLKAHAIRAVSLALVAATLITRVA